MDNHNPTGSRLHLHRATGRFAHMTRVYGLHTLRDLLVVVRTLNRLAARSGQGTAPAERAGSHCRPLRETIELDDLATTVTAM